MFSIVPDTAACFAQVLLADRRLQRLERHIRTNLHEPLSLKRAAKLCGLSPTWFSNYFHAHTGMTFTVWYRRVRIERAKVFLGDPDLKIEAIAYDVGYAHVGTFERAFRACTGACPKAYRETLKLRRDETVKNAYNCQPSDNSYWIELLGALNNYMGGPANYDTVPTVGAGGYNSNGFTHGILAATGGSAVFLFPPPLWQVGGCLFLPATSTNSTVRFGRDSPEQS